MQRLQLFDYVQVCVYETRTAEALGGAPACRQRRPGTCTPCSPSRVSGGAPPSCCRCELCGPGRRRAVRTVSSLLRHSVPRGLWRAVGPHAPRPWAQCVPAIFGRHRLGERPASPPATPAWSPPSREPRGAQRLVWKCRPPARTWKGRLDAVCLPAPYCGSVHWECISTTGSLDRRTRAERCC